MGALEEELRPTSVTHVGLNVFSFDTVARALRRTGYHIVSTFMLERVREDA